MPPETALIVEQVTRPLPRSEPVVRHTPPSIQALRKRALMQTGRPDPRDSCGLNHQFACRSWPLLVRLIWWLLRHRDT
ncbi:hypothetical protein [Sphingobium aquiterrae]|uniref:hypothetical protein n=1 Tax=Sphingobium aquiterrae TaxID=2038656 RepID=UPI003017979B